MARATVDPVPQSTRAIPVEKTPSARAASPTKWKISGRATRQSLALPGDGDVPTVRVRATEQGFYGWMTRYPGDVFDIAAEPVHAEDRVGKLTNTLIYRKGDPVAYSPFWMEPVDPTTPQRITTEREALARENDAALNVRRGASTGDKSVI